MYIFLCWHYEFEQIHLIAWLQYFSTPQNGHNCKGKYCLCNNMPTSICLEIMFRDQRNKFKSIKQKPILAKVMMPKELFYL